MPKDNIPQHSKKANTRKTQIFRKGDRGLSKITPYAVLSALVIASYALAVSGLSLITNDILQTSDRLLISGIIVFILAVLFNPIRQKLQERLDSAIHRDQNNYPQRLQAFTRDLTRSIEIATIVNTLGQYVFEDFHPSQMHVFVFDPMKERFVTKIGQVNLPTTDLHFSIDSSIVMTLSKKKGAIDISSSPEIITFSQAEQARLSLLGAQLYIPMPGQEHLTGWLALGLRQSAQTYTSKEISYLESLCDQAALAIERSQVVANLERRVREMDVLSRIAQGVSITITYDDILELIFAQTNQVISTRDFRVTLTQDGRDYCYHAFFIQDNERYRERENLPIPANSGLEGLVIQNQQALVTNDYEKECRRQAVLPDAPGLFAWVSVPLNAGAKTIGALSMGSRDPASVYPGRQIYLLQAIADQAAGAIVKARLLAETESKALQLATLNEIGRSLTSTLEIKPLLNQIMQSSTHILNCEAGSLFMVDDQTGELIFEVTVGPVADYLIGQRLPPGTGIAGKSAQSGNALIVNEVHKSEYWFRDADDDTGFVTRDVLVVPMKIKEKVLGVIEVINKQDGSPFNQDDQKLLATFTSQAAIAIENARLYTQTDEALRSRVEELSIMQRIDRELNTSLDLTRSLEITLAWSLRQSRSEAGVICVPDPALQETGSSFTVTNYHGYTKTPEIQAGNEEPHPFIVELRDDATINSLNQGQPVVLDLAASQKNQYWVIKGSPLASDHDNQDNLALFAAIEELDLPGAKTNILIPIRRQSEVLALMILESQEQNTFGEEAIAFLTRICDHAAIAISNAQLYAELQAANLAKSDFISLVSHELKTPMTSIKGYTDLLAQGTVGSINPAQADFLNIIRSNTNRMATLVSDLTDISRIETGRLRLEFSAVSLSQVVEEVNRSIQAQIDQKQQRFTVDLPEDLPLLWGDYQRLTQIVSNLVSNANKYTPEDGSICIAARLATSRDEAGETDVVQIDISDTGIGISPIDQSQIFQKFFRSENPEVRNISGTGLGLSITRHLVNMQGGKIWLESIPDKGTTFSFTIPVATGVQQV